MAGPAQAFEVRIVIGTPMSLSLDVVNGCGGDSKLAAQAVLTKMITASGCAHVRYPTGYHNHAHACSALLMLLPSLIAMCFTIA
jgi:hypothetical protein